MGLYSRRGCREFGVFMFSIFHVASLNHQNVWKAFEHGHSLNSMNCLLGSIRPTLIVPWIVMQELDSLKVWAQESCVLSPAMNT